MEVGDHIAIDLARDDRDEPEAMTYGVVTKVDDRGLPQEMIEVGSVHRVWGHSTAQRGEMIELCNEHKPREYKGSYTHIIRQFVIAQYTGGELNATK